MTDPVMKNASSDTRNSSQRALILYAVVAVGLAFFIRLYVAAPFIVSGASMEPNFYDLHYLIVDRVTYDFSEPQRGDVIVFKLPQNTGRDLIKRVIGLPGDTVTVNGNAVTITNSAHPQGFTLQEPYLLPENLGGAGNVNVTIPDGEYFVLGDNRRVSADSRLWGLLPKEDIIGRVFLRLFPVTKIGILPGESRYNESPATSTNS